MNRKLKKAKRFLRRPLEWFGIGLGLLSFMFVSRKMLLRLCDFASCVMYFFDSKGKKIANENLTVMFGDSLSKSIREKIVRRSYRNMARSVGHAFWTCRNAVERVKESGEVSEDAAEFLAANRPAVTVSGHIGCWEILSQLAFLNGHKMMSVAKKIGTGGMTKLLMKARESIGQEIVASDGAFRPLMQGLRDGKSLGLLVDQSVSPKKGGIWVRFFGCPVSVSAAPAFFAAKGKAPSIVAWSRPLKDGRYRCEKIAVYSSGDARDIWAFTQRCLWDLERVIRRHPSCWVLNYRYFSQKPTAEESAELEKREAKTR